MKLQLERRILNFRHLILLPLLLLPLAAFPAEPQSRAEDRAAIERAALDYIEGWYTNDPERMERALHYEAVKRLVGTNDNGFSFLDQGSALRLVQATRPAPGEQSPSLDGRQRDVTILDLFGNTASVKVVAEDWVDYLHLAKWNGQWKIINILWELKPEE